MAITLTGTGGLMTRLGKIGKFASGIRTYQGTIATNSTAILDQYDGNRDLVADVPGATPVWQTQVEVPMQALTTDASATLQFMANQASPNRAISTNLQTSVLSLVNQMVTSSQSCFESTIACTGSNIAGVTQSGNGTFTYSVVYVPAPGVLVTTSAPNLQNIVNELATLACTADSYSGTATAGQEVFTFSSEPAQTDKWAVDWPTGSGVTQTVNVTGPDNNLIVDGNFEQWTGTSPTNWTIATGTAGSNVVRSTTIFYPFASTGSSISFVGNSSITQAIYQSFGGTVNTTTLQPLTSYQAIVRVCGNASLVSSGYFAFSLVDENGDTLANPYLASLEKKRLYSGISTSWIDVTAEFITPKNIPNNARFRIECLDPLNTGETLYIDSVMMVAMTPAYQQGPRMSVFAGSVPFAIGDGQTVTSSNNYGGSGSLDNFNTLFDRMFDMKSLGYQLPVSGSPTISNSLIG